MPPRALLAQGGPRCFDTFAFAVFADFCRVERVASFYEVKQLRVQAGLSGGLESGERGLGVTREALSSCPLPAAKIR